MAAKKAPKKSMAHTAKQTSTSKDSIRKMPTVAAKKGTLHPHHVADKKASQVSERVHGHPKSIKTPEANMPNGQLFHHKRVVKEGHHMATAGGVGKTQKRVPAEQTAAHFSMMQNAKKRRAKRSA